MVQSLADVLRVDSVMRFDASDDMINSFQFQQITAGPTADADTLTDFIAILEAIYTILLPAINVLVAFDKIRVRNLTTALLVGEASYVGIVAGTQAGDALPPGAAPVVEFGTPVPRVRLRKFFPPPSEAGMDASGRIGAAPLALYTAAGVLMLAPSVAPAETYQFGYNSPKTGSFVVPVVGSVRNVIGYQRRRKQGVGS